MRRILGHALGATAIALLLVVLYVPALARTEVAPLPSTGATQPAAQNCSLISVEEATKELGSPVTLTTETGPCMFETAQGFTLMMNTEVGEQDPMATHGQALPEPYPGCIYNKMGEDTLLAQCTVKDHGFIVTGIGVHGQSIGQPQIDAVSRLINLAMTRV